ncbi:ABC transporter substrate-binding protein [Mobilitalea sibirica]|uniref:ABC transporter substrate-binding protein n=1 Tax=Mobilitalea sibirica TaxID=1462919 RepID=A0A8J7H126_9FIRM|nr:ABC transporter substrate-binding protein [Mobilitalea sibirica]MBH1942324.1 ABC transporter substrate-binding protein [Mobilitalea sibirica]
MFKKLIAVTLIMTLMIAATACGKKDMTTFDKIKDKKEVTFAMSGAYPPFNYIDEDGEVTGFDIEIANAIADKMGVKAVPITTAWDGIIGGLKGNRFDMIIGSMAITEDRLKEVNFSDPYYYDGAQFFAKTDSGLNSIEDLDNGKVGVVTGTTFHEYLEGLDNIDEILQFESDVDNMKSVEQGRIDGLVTGKFVGLMGPEKYGVEIEPVGSLLYAEDIAIAIRKEDTKLLEEVNKALKAIIEDGTYEEISNRYFGQNILEK